MEKVILSNSYFADIANILKQGESVKLLVGGNSMYPFIHGNIDLVELIPYCGEDLPRWTIIFYCYNGHYMIHRIVGKSTTDYIMMGDGNIRAKEKAGPDNIFGILYRVYYPNGNVLDCSSSDWLMKGAIWYHLRLFRRILIKILRILDAISINKSRS